MSKFNSEEATRSQSYDRKRLKPGRYLVKCTDAREVVGGYYGDRFQLDFEVVKGLKAEPGTVKNERIPMKNIEALSGKDKDKAKKDMGKIQVVLGAFLGIKPAAVTNDVFSKACREQKVKSTQEGVEVLSESTTAEKITTFGKLAVLVCEPCVIKSGERKGKKSAFYTFSPFKGDDSIFQDYDPKYDLEEDEEDEDEDDGDASATLSRGRRDEEPEVEGDEPPPVVEDEPLTKAAKAGYVFNTKSPAGKRFYFKRGENKNISEADLIAKFS